MKKFQWQTAVLAFILTLGVAVGVVYLRRQHFLHEPLLKRIKALEAVEEVKMEHDRKAVVVSLNSVDNIAETYQALKKQITTDLGPEYRLELVDKRDEVLEAAYQEVHLLLYEAQQRGNYAEAGKEISQILSEYNLEHLLLIDDENIYLQIQNQEAYLYEIIARRHRKEGEYV